MFVQPVCRDKQLDLLRMKTKSNMHTSIYETMKGINKGIFKYTFRKKQMLFSKEVALEAARNEIRARWCLSVLVFHIKWAQCFHYYSLHEELGQKAFRVSR